MKKFPEGFYWGAATASYQVEGGIDNCDWAKAASEGRVPVCGMACDHYHRYEEDFDIAKSLGHNAHRFSIEWARIEPEEGRFDQVEIEHYRKVLLSLKKQNIEPFVTLWHFTLPLWFSESGGFERKDSPEIFARYCLFVVNELQDLCTHFSTINEPNVWAGHGWLYGAWPPFKRGKIFNKQLGKDDGSTKRVGAVAKNKNILLYFKVEKNLINGHIMSYDAIKKIAPQVKISLVKHVRWFTSDDKIINRLKAGVMSYLQSGRFLNKVRRHLDEIGLNYYRHTMFGDNKNYLLTDMGWKAYPSGLYGALMSLKKYKLPVIISEAGLADEDDDMRALYIKVEAKAMQRAICDGVDLRGHMYWSLLDNYEWALGFEKRFGLVEINYDTLERTIRPSAYVYKQICETNAVVE